MVYDRLLLTLFFTCTLFASERFYNVDENLLIDAKLNIEWAMVFEKQKSFSNAQNYCKSLNIKEKSFRLPTMQELLSLVKYSLIESNNFAFSGDFWSSSLDETDEKHIKVFSVSLPSGTFETHNFNATLNTLCVHDIGN